MYNFIDFSQFSPDEILIYLRKSRSDDPLLSVEEVLAKHEAMLDEWAERNLKGRIPDENRFREVVSGETISDRPEIQKILRMIESPKIKAVLIVEVQRLSRGDLEDAGRLIKLFRYTNTLVITPQKTYDIRDEYDRDSFERELKRGNEFLEYMKKIMGRGKLLSISQGGNYIASIPPYGYTKTWVMDGKRKCPTLAINEEEAAVVRMIFDMYVNQDLGRPTICYRLDEMGIKPPKGEHWSPASLKDLLSNVHYLGKVKWNWRKTVTVVEDSEISHTRPKAKIGEYLIYEGRHEAIISEELFQAAQDKIGRNHRAKASTKIRNPLAGLVYCRCGRAMSLRTYKSHDGAPRIVCDGQVYCHTGSCTYDELLKLVEDALKKCIDDFEVRIHNDQGDSMKIHEDLLRTLEKKMRDLEARELAQWESRSHPDPSQRMPSEIFAKLNERLLQEKEDIMEAILRVKRSIPDPVDFQEKLVRFQDALNALHDPEKTAEQKNRLLKACIDRIEYSREKPERIRNPQKRTKKNGREDGKGRSLKPTVLKSGATWTSPPIELEVKLRLV